jgi:hypothetical protein
MHKQPWVDPMLASCIQDCSSVWITGLCILPNISEAAPPFITTRAKTSTTTGKQASHPLCFVSRLGVAGQLRTGTDQPCVLWSVSSQHSSRLGASGRSPQNRVRVILLEATGACCDRYSRLSEPRAVAHFPGFQLRPARHLLGPVATASPTGRREDFPA